MVAGSVGAVIANRLSENLNWKILLLEPDGDESEISDVPALAAYVPGSDGLEIQDRARSGLSGSHRPADN